MQASAISPYSKADRRRLIGGPPWETAHLGQSHDRGAIAVVTESVTSGTAYLHFSTCFAIYQSASFERLDYSIEDSKAIPTQVNTNRLRAHFLKFCGGFS